MSEAVIVREWGADVFHQQVLRFEALGYITRLETYRISAEMHPETGEILCLHSIEMRRPDAVAPRAGPAGAERES